MAAGVSSEGISRMWHRKSLVVLIYAIGLVVAVLVGSAVFRLLSFAIGETGFSSDLVTQFDIVVWADIWREIASGFAAVARQVVLAGLIVMVWKVASSVGVIHALQGDGRPSFWEGVSRFTIRGLGLGLLFLVPLLVLLTGAIVVGEMIASSSGEIGAFWTRFAAIPLVVIVLGAAFDLCHDYARMHLVLSGATIRRSWLRGIAWPFRNFRAVLLYKLWFFVSAVLWIAVFVVGFYMPDQTVPAVLLAFVVQQILIVGRTAAYVSWIGAQVAFFERHAPPVPESEVAPFDEQAPEIAVEAAPYTVKHDEGVA